MENPPLIPLLPIERCGACFKNVVSDDVYCPSCGYPLKGTNSEQNTFLAKRHKLDFDLVKFKKRINDAGKTLFYLSGVFFLGAVINFFSFKDDPQVLGIVLPNIILVVLFLLLGEYSKKKTLACFISGLCLYIIVQVLNIFNGTTGVNLISGVMKIVIIIFLVLGIRSAIEIEKIKRENNII